jgi:CRP-like cAMP-binding protein
LRALTLEQFEAEQVVFQKGEAGTKFYIIIQGKVGVYVSDPKRGGVSRPSAV